MNFVYSDNALKEGAEFLKSKEAFMSPSGGLNYGLGSSRNKLPMLVLHNFTNGLNN